MTNLEFTQTLNSYRDICQAILFELERGKEMPEGVGHLDIYQFDMIGGALSDIRTEMFEPRRFGRGLPDEGRAA